MYRVCLFLLFASLSTVAFSDDFTGRDCLSGSYHKDVSGPEGPEYTECLAYKENSCCTPEIAAILGNASDIRLYNFQWTPCGPISKSCEQFLIWEECFYECEPVLEQWETYSDGSLFRVPICSTYCDDWFSACKDDLTCAANWLTDWDYDEDTGINTCASSCRTYEEVYGSGQGLCETMWGDSFVYEEDPEQCLTMWFYGINPNERFFEDASSSCSSGLLSSSVLELLGPVK
eukprot:CAMPEP_0174252744 /NCGR_PEP_ID=MMETSP0439-20130205/2111_1 /TAXON_ID=0 /ORGANISM="Stereomyxa ramosa, Strain Chinc5" /LENGTH=231 /DNA_ID=CAMNT_0015333347 /DNA_START=14 /DNA_END=709 /DNA_ORIENTATION=-